MKKTIIHLHEQDAYNFYVGLPVCCVMTDDGALRRATWRDRLRFALKRALWWRQPRARVAMIEGGNVTIVPMRWSWTRWRWL